MTELSVHDREPEETEEGDVPGPEAEPSVIVPATTPEMSDVVAAVLESGEADDAPDADAEADADVEAAAPRD